MEILLFVDVRVAVNVTPTHKVIRDNLQDIVFVGLVVVVQLQLLTVVIVPAVEAEGIQHAGWDCQILAIVKMAEHTMMV